MNCKIVGQARFIILNNQEFLPPPHGSHLGIYKHSHVVMGERIVPLGNHVFAYEYKLGPDVFVAWICFIYKFECLLKYNNAYYFESSR